MKNHYLIKTKHEEWIGKPMRGKRATNESNIVLIFPMIAVLAVHSGKI